MCRPMVRHSDLAAIHTRFAIRGRPGIAIAPTWKLSPGDCAPVVRRGESGRIETALLRWGLTPNDPVPGQAKRPVTAIPATDLKRTAFCQTLLQTNRCILPIDAFYAGCGPVGSGRSTKRSRVWAFSRDDSKIMGVAGLWAPDPSRASQGGFSIVTTSPNESVALLDDRMPAILFEDDEKAWLSARTDGADAFYLLKPVPGEWMRAWPVAPLLGDGPELLRRVG